jgi:hypothetical protein
MEISLRPWLSTGVALVGAGAIAMAPISPITVTPTTMSAPAAVSAAVHSAAFEIPYILTLPVVRQSILNQIDYWVIRLQGFADAGTGLVDTLLATPQTLVTITQQLFALDFVGAFDTFSTAATNAVIAVGQPLLDSYVQVNQMNLLVQTALFAAIPTAFISVVNGVLAAGNGVINSAILGTQGVVQAIASLNLSNIVNATIDGAQGFVQALGSGAGDIVAGIEAAQLGITTALQAGSAPAPGAPASAATALAAPEVGAVPDLGKATVAVTVGTTDGSTKHAVAEEPTAVELKSKPAGAKAAPGSAVASASKRAAHDTSGAPRKAKAGASKG